jgi:hypothetical protein
VDNVILIVRVFVIHPSTLYHLFIISLSSLSLSFYEFRLKTSFLPTLFIKVYTKDTFLNLLVALDLRRKISKNQFYRLTNMNNMSLSVQHYVTIMSILDLQQIPNHRIGCHRFYEITASRLKFFARFITVLMQKVFIQSRIRLSSKLIT